MPEIKKIRILSQLLFISFCGGQCTTYFLWHWPNCMLYWCRQRWNLKSSHPRFSKNVTYRLLTESSKKFLLYFLFKKEKKINQLRTAHATAAPAAKYSTIKTNWNPNIVTDILTVPHSSTNEIGLQCPADFAVCRTLWLCVAMHWDKWLL